MSVSRGKRYEKMKSVKTAKPGEFLEIGTKFRMKDDASGSVYSVVVNDYSTTHCSKCDLEAMCRLSSRSVPKCTILEREDGVSVHFEEIYYINGGI